MLNSTDRMASEKAEREAAAKSARRAEEASIVAGLRNVLQADEQLLGFARARIAGGIKGRLNIGPEAFFAPFVNIGLTERRFIIQHLHGETGKPSEILPHFFALADLQTIHFADIETYGGTPASRLVLYLANGQSFRLRLTGENNFASSKSLAEVFKSLTSVRKSASGPTQRVCISCRHIMDRPSKFCPYCGTSQMDSENTGTSEHALVDETTNTAEPEIEKVTVVVTETRNDLLDDALSFLRNEPAHVVAPAEPADPVVPAEPVEPVEPAKPVEPAEPGASASESSTGASIESPAIPYSAAPAVAPPVYTFPDFSTSTAWPAPPSPFSPAPSHEPLNSRESAPSAVEPTPAYEAPAVTEPHYSTLPHDVPAVEPTPAYEAPAVTEPHYFTLPDDLPAAEPTPAYEAPAVTAPHYSTLQDDLPDAEPTPAYEARAVTEPQYAGLPDAPVAEQYAAPETRYSPTTSTYSEAASSEAHSVPREEAPKMPVESAAPKLLRVHFHIKHPAVQFNEVITGKDADEVVARLKDRVVSELKFPIKLAAMRLSPLEFAQEIVSKYNQEERQALPRPTSCREFLHLVQAIGYATVEAV